MSIRLDDKMFINHDEIAAKSAKSGLWAKTQIIAGYGYHKNKYGISEFDEVVFDKTNMVTLGGVQYAMEMIFGVKGPANVPKLNSIETGIGAIDSSLSGSDGMPHPYGQKVCLFGIGADTTIQNNLSVKEVDYKESSITGMIPFRCTADSLSDIDKYKYYGKKTVQIGDTDPVTAYYLKTFDDPPVIYHRQKDGLDDEEGVDVDNDAVFTMSSTASIETFTECKLTIAKNDVREWFELNNIEHPRVTSIGLFTAVYDAAKEDYTNIMLFSKLNIPTEPLTLVKDLEIIYRVYGS